MRTIGLSPTSATAATGSRASRRAVFQIRCSIARLLHTSSTFSVQNAPAIPSGTTANVSSVNRGPYGLSSSCQLLSE